ncbi:hypothetical protein [Corynebacterium sp.]|uniref:hypothetical protein n=1 Tax=Corynebacterium sp. TaxID=1720 RepID=UPI002F41A190
MGAEQDLAAISESALVVSQLFLAAPNSELRGALQDDGALAEWPLTDQQSQRGIAILRDAVREGNVDSHEDLERDHLYLFIGIGKPLAPALRIAVPVEGGAALRGADGCRP